MADDHEVFRYGLVQLIKHGITPDDIIEAGRYEHALQQLDRPDLKLALVDLDMPGLTGVCDLVAMTERRPDIRVVVISGSSARDDILNALAAGVHGYILKSQGSEVLLEKLRYVLSGEIYVPPIVAKRDVANVEPVLPHRHLPEIDSLALSERQREVLKGLIDGLSNKEIAKRLGVSEGTVKMHMAALFRALGATNRTHAAAIGRQFAG